MAPLDLESTVRHLNYMIDAGISGLNLLGSVGESTALEYDEKLIMLEAMVRAVNGRVPVLSEVAKNTNHVASRFAQDAQRIGLDGLMVLPAMIYKADSREAIAHFRTVAQSTSLPIMIYNNPPAYNVDISPEQFSVLANEPNIVAIKESSGDIRRITDLINLHGDRFILFSGVDDLVLESILLGATGWVSGLVNAFPYENQALWKLAMEGRWTEERDLYRRYTPLLHLDTKTKLVQYIKLTMAEVGLGSETTRAPRLSIVGEERAAVLEIIRNAISTRPALAAF